MLPEIVDVFGLGTESWDEIDDAGIFDANPEPVSLEETVDEEEESDVEDSEEDSAESEEIEPEIESDSTPAPTSSDDVTDEDIDSLFGPA